MARIAAVPAFAAKSGHLQSRRAQKTLRHHRITAEPGGGGPTYRLGSNNSKSAAACCLSNPHSIGGAGEAMQGDPKVIEYLNRGLRSELTAINQYWIHYRLLDNWGYKDLAKKWRKESIEEMQHADKFTVRIIFLEGFPNMQVLDPLRIGQTVKEVLDCDLAAELDARALYQEAATYCHSVKDYVSRDLFEELMKDEEEHIDFLETQLDLVKKLGLELYAQHHIGELEDGD
jgi:bacterioferritin